MARDNQALVRGARTVIVCVRPQVVAAVLEPLELSADQAVVSVVAGVPIAQLATLVEPARDVARAIPLPPVSGRRAATPVHPPTRAVRELFDRLGGHIAVEREEAFEALSAATATIAAHFRYVETIAWVTPVCSGASRRLWTRS